MAEEEEKKLSAEEQAAADAAFKAFTNGNPLADPGDIMKDSVFIISIGSAPNPRATDMESLYRFGLKLIVEDIKRKEDPREQDLSVWIYTIDTEWNDRYKMDEWERTKNAIDETYNINENSSTLMIVHSSYTFPYRTGDHICDSYDLQRDTFALGSLEALGKTCPVEKGSIWENFSNIAKHAARVYIHNAAWFTLRGTCSFKQNKLFESTCGLAAVATVNPNTFILTDDTTTFQRKEQVKGVGRYLDLYVTPMPGTFNPNLKYPESTAARNIEARANKAMGIQGGRKRTRKGLKKRRATRRWKHRS
jgi:hypothetical protein